MVKRNIVVIVGILLTILSINSYAAALDVVKPEIQRISFFGAKWHINYKNSQNGANLLKEEVFVDGNSDRVVTVGTGATRGFSLLGSYAEDVCHKAYVVVYDKGHSRVTQSDVFNFGDTSKCNVYVEAADSLKPLLKLKGKNPQLITLGELYRELGATALDKRDGELTTSISIDSSVVDTTALGDYVVKYEVVDAAGNKATATRTVTVVASDFKGELEIHKVSVYKGRWSILYQDIRIVPNLKKEVLFINNVAKRTVTAGSNSDYDRGFSFGGSYAEDSCHEAYIVAYDVNDNEVSKSAVFEFGDTSKCGVETGVVEITNIKYYNGQWNIAYKDLATSSILGVEKLFVNGTLDRQINAGTTSTTLIRGFRLIGAYDQTICHEAYIVIYDKSDQEVTRTATFNFGDTAKCGEDMVKPVITLIGGDVTLVVGASYIDAGATAVDDVDGDITSDINTTSSVDTSVAGTYEVKYNVKDSAGNIANEIRRTVTVNPLVLEQGSLTGRVMDISGSAIDNVRIEVNGVESFTDNTGNFSFNEVNVSSRVIVNFSHSSYLNNNRIIQVRKNQETVVSIVLEQALSQQFNSTTDITASITGGGELLLAANTYVDENGNSYTGDVNLSLNYYPITTPRGREMFPGNFDAINSANEQGTLRSYGFVIIDLRDTVGNALNINGTAEIAIPADLSLGVPPATIPLWYYDEEQGFWIEDGIATYDASTQRYIGNITRIATYNLDVFMTPGNLKVCVEDSEGNKLSNAYIRIESGSTGWFGQVGPTNNSGYINIINVMGNTDLNLSAYTLDGKYGTYINNPIRVTPSIDNTLPSCIVVSDGNSTLTGVVKKIGTSIVLPGVKVILRTSGIYLQEVLTDSNGVYNFINLNGGLVYSMDYIKENYNQSAYSNVHLEDNQVKSLELVYLSQNVDTLNGVVSGTVTNALNGSGVSGVTLKIRKGINNRTGIIAEELQTLTNGTYSTTLRHGRYTVEAIKNGFISTYFTISVIGGESSINQNGSISPLVAIGDMRIILTWGATPRDLDSHIVRKTGGTMDYHVYFAAKSRVDAQLDHDDTSSYGPETITVSNPQANSIYTYYVHNYSGGTTGLKTSNAKVIVAFNNTQQTFNVPNEDGLDWKVFEIINGVIVPCSVNCIQRRINLGIRANQEMESNFSNHVSTEEALEIFRNLPSK
jgi:hypothetical protein